MTTNDGGVLPQTRRAPVQRSDSLPLHQATREDAPEVSTGTLPDLERVRELLEAAHQGYAGVTDGAVADYIPALGVAAPELFGIAVVGVRGRSVGVGDHEHPFTIQSVAKPFQS